MLMFFGEKYLSKFVIQFFSFERVVMKLLIYDRIVVLMKSAYSQSSSGGKFDDSNVSVLTFSRSRPASFSETV